MSGPPQVAVLGYEGACAAIRARLDQLNISRSALDSLATLPDGNAAKLLSPVPDKRMMAETMLRIMDMIGLDVVVVPRAGFEQEIADLVSERLRPPVPNGRLRSVLRIKKKARLERIFSDPNFFKKIGRTGGRACAKRKSASERSRSASVAAKARWTKERALRRASRCAPASDTGLAARRA